jgi:hypothetical protein
MRREVDGPIKVNFHKSNFDDEYTKLPITINPLDEEYGEEELAANKKRLQKRAKSLTNLENVIDTLEREQCDLPFERA